MISLMRDRRILATEAGHAGARLTGPLVRASGPPEAYCLKATVDEVPKRVLDKMRCVWGRVMGMCRVVVLLK